MDSKELIQGQLTPATRFGWKFVFWRDPQSGKPLAFKDECPHRLARLSQGKLVQGAVECPFHGFRFDGQGSCAWVPELKRGTPKLKAAALQLVEKDGWIWAFWDAKVATAIATGESATPVDSQPEPWFETLTSDFAYSQVVTHWEKDYSRCVENQLDFAHLPFVHRNSIGRGFDPSGKTEFELNDRGIKVKLPSHREDHPSFFEFRYSNFWQLHVQKRLINTLVFVPVHSDQTRFYMRSYQSFVRVPGLSHLVGWISDLTNRFVLGQDWKIVQRQVASSQLALDREILFPSDKPILHFRKTLEECAVER
jgi:phenylpropionate dioxygenase-like ring-hydroxylating dioxygenase large terminal subunit